VLGCSAASTPGTPGPASASAAPSVSHIKAATGRTARSFAGTPTVGALFMPGGYPALHTCTASVIRSKGRDVIMTAAHCMTGNGRGYVFVPGDDNGKAPYGVWRVTSAYGSPGWIHHTNTQRDWAFLRVASQVRGGKRVQLQDVVGGNRLGSVAKAKSVVAVPAYPLGGKNQPVTCRAPVYLHAGFPAFNCGGYPGGTSGSPWLRGHGRVRTVVAVIGGLHQGGCLPSTSYSARLGRPALATFARAEQGGTTDVFPSPPGDGCS
jgi:V8-like Glu-specific endopeptidase